MKMSSPERLQTILAPVACFTRRASPTSNALERCTTSGRTSAASQATSFSTSFR